MKKFTPINKKLNSYFFVMAFTFYFLASAFLPGCAQKNNLEEAGSYVKQSQDYYQRAIRIYKDLIAKGKDLDKLHFQLGKLYYDYGEFKQAQGEFNKTNTAEAKKYLAISYYKSGNFTDALEAFNKEESLDPEYLYYHGLTCEKLNLFDQALGIYKKTGPGEFLAASLERINIIEKQAESKHIKDIDPAVYKILENAPLQEEYPQAGALILSCNEKIEVTPENTQTAFLHYVIKILNERGKEGFSETQISYDSTYEKVELEYARTIKPDGTVAEVGSRHIRDVSKYLNFPLYSNARVYIISFPEIAEGSTIEYKVKVLRNQLINKKDFVVSYPLQSQEPIISANFKIVLPAERALHIKTINDKYNDFGANLKPNIQEEEGHLIYSWEFKNIPQIIPESNMPSSVEVNPTILLSAFSSWDEVYNWWWKLAKDKIKPDKAIKDKVLELTNERESEEAKIRAIYNFCAQKIRYVAVEYGQAGYEPHQASDVFKNKYGDCKDQAILLVTMLKEAGVSAWPVLIPTKGAYNLNEDFPAMLFNHAIACVSLNDRIVFLDPTAETCPFDNLPEGDQARRVLIVKEGGYKIEDTPLYPPEHNLAKQHLKIRINGDETISAEKSIFTYGAYELGQRYWMLYTPPELIQEALKEAIQDISIGATLDNYNIENLEDLNKPVVLTYTFKGPEFFSLAGKMRVMPQLSSFDTSLVAKDRRKYPIDFSILDTKETVFEIDIPQDFVITYMPQSINEENQWLKFMSEYDYKDNKIYFRQKTELKKNIITQEDYLVFKSFFTILAKKIKERVILEKRVN